LLELPDSRLRLVLLPDSVIKEQFHDEWWLRKRLKQWRLADYGRDARRVGGSRSSYSAASRLGPKIKAQDEGPAFYATGRRVTSVEGELTMDDRSVKRIDRAFLLAPAEKALRAMSWAMMPLALAFVLSRRGH
jgi:hypothetical protein